MRFFKQHKKSATIKPAHRKGFTLAEMLLVTLVIAVLMSIGGRAYFTERDRFLYNNALTNILNVIKTARNSAISSYGVPVAGKNIVPLSGYGVYINLKPDEGDPHFTLFASMGKGADGTDEILNTTFDKGVVTSPDNMADVILETLTLPKQVHFQFFKFDDDEKWSGDPPEPNATEAVIFFRPPLAETYLGGGDPGSYKDLEELNMRFYNPNEVRTSKKRCQHIGINRIKTFPNIEYTDCDESNYKLQY